MNSVPAAPPPGTEQVVVWALPAEAATDLALLLGILGDFLRQASHEVIVELAEYPAAPSTPSRWADWVADRLGEAALALHTLTTQDRRTTMTVLDPTLSDTLRALKLTGMLQGLDARLAQARAGKIGHLDFLQLLCEDELARRQSAALVRRLRRARFDTDQATLETFDYTANPKLPAAALHDLAALRWLEAGESIILYGPVGVGKTHTSPKASATGSSAAEPRSGSPRPAGCSPTSPAATPTAPGTNGSASTSGPRC